MLGERQAEEVRGAVRLAHRPTRGLTPETEWWGQDCEVHSCADDELKLREADWPVPCHPANARVKHGFLAASLTMAAEGGFSMGCISQVPMSVPWLLMGLQEVPLLLLPPRFLCCEPQLLFWKLLPRSSSPSLGSGTGPRLGWCGPGCFAIIWHCLNSDLTAENGTSVQFSIPSSAQWPWLPEGLRHWRGPCSCCSSDPISPKCPPLLPA